MPASPAAPARRRSSGLRRTMAAAGLCLALGAASATAQAAPPAHTADALVSDAVDAAPTSLLAQRIRQVLAAHHVTSQPRPLLGDLQSWLSCDRDTSFDRYIAQQSAGLTFKDRLLMQATFADQLPFYEALLMPASDSQIQLTDHASVLRPTFARLKGFWDIDSSHIDLTEMRGTMLTDAARVAATYRALGMSATQADRLAQLVSAWARTSPAIDGGRNPLLTLNAVSVPAQGGRGPRIVVGQGMMQANDQLGGGELAQQLVLAHEYGHQVQFQIGMTRTNPLSAAQSERVELHADASAAYFATHRRGLDVPAGRLSQMTSDFYALGDCGVLTPGHHGTPAQRARAAAWGAHRAAAAGSTVEPAKSFAAAYLAALPTQIVPEPRRRTA